MVTNLPLILCLFCASTANTMAEDAQATESFFRQHVEPILVNRCLECHGDKREGDLDLRTRLDALKGSENGVILVAGKSDASALYELIYNEKMPPKKPLSDEEVEVLEKWIEDGVYYPPEPLVQPPALPEEEWWSLTPLHLADDIDTDMPGEQIIDQFIRKKLREKGLVSSPPTDPRTLIRRVTFDLHGLPPTPEEINSFLDACASETGSADQVGDAAYRNLVNRLLDSSRYGERWARHWMDIVHYGETHGYDKDQRRDHAWPYRDYVIRAFNTDKPYSEFVVEQLAGDAIKPGLPDGIVATGFLAAGPWDLVGQKEVREGTIEKKRVRNLDRDDMVTNVFNTFQSTTVQCARCHNHKFDSIARAEYYQLQSIFAGIDRANREYDDPVVAVKRSALIADIEKSARALEETQDLIQEGLPGKYKGMKKSLERLGRKRASIDKEDAEQIAAIQTEIHALIDHRAKAVKRHIKKNLLKTEAEQQEKLLNLRREMDNLPKIGQVYSIRSLDPRPIFDLPRGNEATPSEQVFPATLSHISELSATLNSEMSGEAGLRLELARWIVDSRNALTWRSIVNRVWQYHFGNGLVDTPNDFGRAGSQPSHPELLDWLAVEFRETGSFKGIHRKILNSATYRQSSGTNAHNSAIDGSNQFLWHMNRRKLDAESVHDSILSVSGKLDYAMGGPSDEGFAYTHDESPKYDFIDKTPEVYRRSVYRYIVRSVPDPFFEALDCADPSINTPVRNRTLTAPQALAMLNDSFVLKQAEYVATRLVSEHQLKRDQIESLYKVAISRTPEPEELLMLTAFTDEHGLASLARLVFNLNEFMFVD